MKKILALVLTVFLCLSFSLCALAEYTIDGDGNASCESAVGSIIKIDDVNGQITGEDSTVVTTNAGVMSIGSKWATWFSAEKVSDGIYKVTSDGTAMGGTALDMTLSDGQILVVVHSSSSRPTEAGKYPNWEAKVLAKAVKTGDYLVFSEGIDLEEGTGSGYVKVVTEAEANSGNVEFPDEAEEPSESIEASIEESEDVLYSSSEPEVDNESTDSDVVKIPVGDRDGGSLGWLWITLGVVFLCAGVAVLVLVIVWKPKK